MLNRLSEIPWFSAVGSEQGQAEAEQAVKDAGKHLEAGDLQVVWLSKDKLASLDEELNLASSLLWAKLAELPARIKEKAQQAGRESVISEVTDELSEGVFHEAFKGAFEKLEAYGQQVIQLAVGTALYVALLGALWEQFKDTPGWETNPYGLLLKVFETGHWPVGLSGNKVYMI